MALREIGARLTLEGEAQWRAEMSAADRELQNLKSELAATSAEFTGQANTVDALRAKQQLQSQQTEQQRAKVAALAQAVKDGTARWGENTKQVDKLTNQYNYARASLANMENNLEETNRYLEEAESAADGCADSIDGFGKKVKAAGSSASAAAGDVDDLTDAEDDASGSAGNLLANLQSLTGINLSRIATGLTAAGVAKAFEKAWDWVTDLVESTEDLRTDMASLETTASQTGTALDDDLTEALKRAYRVTGDLSTAYQTVTTLLTAGYDGSSMLDLMTELEGAVISFPDTMKFENLADGLQKTLATGDPDRQFKDLLELLGEDADAFAQGLQACNTAGEKQDYILATLAQHGLADVTAKYDDIMADQNALADANFTLETATARLAENLVPLVARVTELKAGFAEFAADTAEMVTNVTDAMSRADDLGMTWSEAMRLQDRMNESGFPITMEKLLAVIDEGSGGQGFAAIQRNAEDASVSLESFIAQLAILQSGQAWTAVQETAEADAALAQSAQDAAAAEERKNAALAAAGETVDTALQKLEALQAKYDAIRQSVDSTVHGFQDLSEVADYMTNRDRYGERVQGAQNDFDALQSQVDYLNTYSANLQTASEWGLSDALIEELSDGSTQSAEILADIVAAGEQSVQDFNAKFAEVETAKETFVETVASILPEFQTTLDEITADLDSAVADWNMYGDANLSANLTMQGYIDGMSARLGELQTLGAAVSDAVHTGYTGADQQASPSKRSAREMDYTLEGFEQTARAQIPDMRELGEELNDSLHDAWQTPRLVTGGEVYGIPAGGAAGASGGDSGEIAALLRENIAMMQKISNMGIYLDREILVGRITPDVNDALGQIYSYDERGLA